MPSLPWDWARPLGLWAFALPFLLLVSFRLRARPASWATGTLALWREVGGADPRHAARRTRRTPPYVWLAVFALCVGALALAGPRGRHPEPPRVWRVVVDPSPSMGLEYRAPDGGRNGEAPGAPRRTRLEVARAAALEWLDARLSPGDRVRWVSPGRETCVTDGDAPPETWWEALRFPAPPPVWELYDEAGTLWIADALPGAPPERAGVFASGGAAVPGPIGFEEGRSLEWDGEALVRGAPAASPPRLVLEGRLPGRIVDFAELWAAERGYVVVREPDDLAGLTLVGEAGREGEVRAVVGRDRWSAEVSGVALGDVGRTTNETPWLLAQDQAGERVPLVTAAPGRIRIGLSSLGAPAGDPAAFAVSWGELLDRCALPRQGVVSHAERVAAGSGLARGTDPPVEVGAVVHGEEARRDRGDPLDAWLAAFSGLLAVAAMSVASR